MDPAGKLMPPCPACGGEVPEDTIWLYMLRFYCSEACVARMLGKIRQGHHRL